MDEVKSTQLYEKNLLSYNLIIMALTLRWCVQNAIYAVVS